MNRPHWSYWKTENKSGRKNLQAEFDLTVTPSKPVTVRSSCDYYRLDQPTHFGAAYSTGSIDFHGPLV